MTNLKVIYVNEESNAAVLSTSYRRVQIVFFAILALLITLVLRLFDLSVFNSGEFQYKTNSGLENISIRGDITDRNGIVLASTIPTASAYIYPKHFTATDRSFALIAKSFNIDIKELKKRIANNQHFVWLKRDLSPKDQEKLHNLGILGVYFIKDQKRIYPHKSLFSHIVGLVDIDNHGISGLESSFNTYLQDDTKQELQTTLDAKVQYVVKQELENAIKQHGAKGGMAVVMDVHTGELLSSVSLPDFNPHSIDTTNTDAFFNKATLGTYEMGSVLKVLTLAIGIDSGMIGIDDSFDVSAPLKIGKYQIKDYRKGKGNILSVPEILMYSSNIGVGKIIQEIGVQKQKEYFKKFGLLSKINTEVPEISSSIYPSDYRWKELNAITMSYGHGISITSIHLIQAFSAIVNGGVFKKATLIKGNNDQISGKRILKQKTSSLMNKVLRLTAESGFAKRANVNEYLIGAKTGTAEKIINGKYDKKLNTAICVAAFPMNKPKYALLVAVDEPKRNEINYGFATGGMVAAPVVASIASRIAPILNVTPVDHTDPRIIKALYIKQKPIYKGYASITTKRNGVNRGN